MEPTFKPLHTKKRGKRRTREGAGGSIKIPLPFTGNGWKDGGGVSLSLLGLCHPVSAGGTALELVVALKGKGPGLLHGGQEGRQPRLPLR